MSHDHAQKVPRGVLIGAAALILVTIGVAAGARSARDDAAGEVRSAAVALRFEDRTDGAVVVRGDDDAVVSVLPAGSNGFVRGVLRGMFRTRKLEGIDPRAPFELGRAANGELVLADPESGHRVALRSFGPTNYAAFERLHAAGTAAR